MAENKDSIAEIADLKKDTDGSAPFTLVNYILFTAGLLDIILGWFLLRGGHITIAPVMLIIGYCVIIPLAIVFRKKHAEKG